VGVGEAGLGTSRLAYECQQMRGAARWLTAQAVSYGQVVPYDAFLPLLHAMLCAQETAPSPQQREAIRTRLADIDPVLAVDQLEHSCWEWDQTGTSLPCKDRVLPPRNFISPVDLWCYNKASLCSSRS
jgi:hypothetical protein